MTDRPKPPKAWRQERGYPLSDYQITQALVVWRAVRDELLKIDPNLFEEDPEALRDTLEGQTEVYDHLVRLIRVALLGEAEKEAMAFEIQFLTEPLKRRMAAAERKVEEAKAAGQRILEAIGEKSFRSPAATIGTRTIPPCLIINDPDKLFKWFQEKGFEIDRYWRIEPKPKDTEIKGLLAELTPDEMPEGAYFTNGSVGNYLRKG